MKWNSLKALPLALVLLLPGCAKEEVNPDTDLLQPELTPGLHVRKADGDLRPNAVHNLQLNSLLRNIDGELLYFDAAAEDIHEFAVGQVLYLAHQHLTEGVSFRKVKSIQNQGGLLAVECEAVGFDEFFSRLDVDVSYVYSNEKLQLRNLEVETQVMDFIDLECAFSNPPRLTPRFGIFGELVFMLDADFAAGSFNRFDYKFKNVRVGAGLHFESNSETSCFAEVSSPPYNLPNIQFAVKGVVVVISSRLSVAAKAGLTLNGRLEYDLGVDLAHPISAELEVSPSTIPFPYYNAKVEHQPFLLPDLGLDFNLLDIGGSSTIELTKTYLLESALYGAYDLLTGFVKLKVPKTEVTFEVNTQDNGIEITSSLNLGLTVAPGFQLNLATIGDLDLNIERELEFTLFEQNAINRSFQIPCSASFTRTDFELSCFEVLGDEGVFLAFRVDSGNGSPQGFRLNIDNREYGLFSYNADHELELAAHFLNNYSTIEIRDAQQPACRYTYRANNPCTRRAYCSDAPIVDSRDQQEYCFMPLADGRQWLSSNLVYAGDGDVGICHAGNNQRCIELGRYYSFEEVEAGNLCPPGWKVPSAAEWLAMLEAESTGASRVRHLMAPNLPSFGGLSPDRTNGFNIIPTGQYQPWRINESIEEQFTGSYLDGDEAFAMFWTSTPLTGTFTNPEFAGEGALAVKIDRNGIYSIDNKVPKTMGLACRCIRN
jgi:uncharacterized protein (TIGR02145 family)